MLVHAPALEVLQDLGTYSSSTILESWNQIYRSRAQTTLAYFLDEGVQDDKLALLIVVGQSGDCTLWHHRSGMQIHNTPIAHTNNLLGRLVVMFASPISVVTRMRCREYLSKKVCKPEFDLQKPPSEEWDQVVIRDSSGRDPVVTRAELNYHFAGWLLVLRRCPEVRVHD